MALSTEMYLQLNAVFVLFCLINQYSIRGNLIDVDKNPALTEFDEPVNATADNGIVSENSIANRNTTQDPKVATFHVPLKPIPTLPSPVTHFDATKFCTCDLKVEVCDVNCCCDKACSYKDRQAFSKCSPHHLDVVDDKYCFQTDILFANNTIYKMNRTKNDLFCVEHDNNKGTHFYESLRPVTNESDFLKLASGYSSDKFSPNITFPEMMTAGDFISIVIGGPHENGTIKHLGYPASFLSSNCEYIRPILYLHDQDSSCKFSGNYRNKSSSENPTRPEFYFENILILKSPSILKAAKRTPGDFIKIEPICTSPSSSETNCKLEKVFVSEVKYVVIHEGVNGITQVKVFINLTNSTIENFMPKFQTLFQWKDEDDAPFYRSGNPGYIRGKPVLAGNLRNTDHNRSIDLSRDSFDWLTINFYSMEMGFCSVGNQTANKYTVLFGEDIETSCLLKLTLDEYQSNTCFSDFRSHLWHVSFPDYIGMFGNSDPRKMDEWVPFIEAPVKIRSAKGGSECFIPHLRIQILYANVGSLSNPQAKIIGAMHWFEKEEISFNYIGLPCNLIETKLYQSSTQVEFIDVTKSSSPEFSAKPVVKARLPNEFFYPILSHAPPQILGMSFMTWLLMISTLIFKIS